MQRTRVGEMRVDVLRWLPTPAAKTASACWIACCCSISCGNNLTNSHASQTSFSPRSLKMTVFRAQATFLAVSYWLIEFVAAQCCLHATMAVSSSVTSLHQHHDTNNGHTLVQPTCAHIYICHVACHHIHLTSVMAASQLHVRKHTAFPLGESLPVSIAVNLDGMRLPGIFSRACIVLNKKGENLASVLGEATALKESLVDKLISLKASQGVGHGEDLLYTILHAILFLHWPYLCASHSLIWSCTISTALVCVLACIH